MRSLALIAIALLLSACSKVTSGPLVVQTPPGWNVEHKPSGGTDFYSLTDKNPGSGLLMFSRWPVPCSRDAIPAVVKENADRFVASIKQNPAVKLTSETFRVESFDGEHCQGSYAAFEFGTAGILQITFMMHVDNQVWNGQFTGTKEDWETSLKVLSSLKPKSW